MKQLFVLLITAGGLLAADATGNWEGTLKATDHEGTAYLVLSQNGEVVSGTGGPSASEQHPISNGKLQSGVITFDIEEGDSVMRFSLKLEGDEIKGTVKRVHDGETQTAELSVKRVKAPA